MTDRLALWKVDGDSEITALSFGTVAPGSSDDLFFRVKNMSAVYKALNTSIGFTGTNQNECFVSLNGRTFAASASLGDLPPSAMSPIVTVRRVTPSTSSTGAKTCTVRLQVTSWI